MTDSILFYLASKVLQEKTKSSLCFSKPIRLSVLKFTQRMTIDLEVD